MAGIVSVIRQFVRDKSAAITIEYVTIAAIGSVIAIAATYQIGGGDDGRSGVSGLVSALSSELDSAAANIGGSTSGGGDNAGSGNGHGAGGNGQGNNGNGNGNGGSNN